MALPASGETSEHGRARAGTASVSDEAESAKVRILTVRPTASVELPRPTASVELTNAEMEVHAVSREAKSDATGASQGSPSEAGSDNSGFPRTPTASAFSVPAAQP